MTRLTLSVTALALALLLGLVWTRAETAPSFSPSGPVATPTPFSPPTVQIRMSTAPDGPARLSYPTHTTQVNPILTWRWDPLDPKSSYNVRVKITDDAGVSLFEETHTFANTPSATLSYTATGEMAFKAYFTAAQTGGTQLQTVVNATQAMTLPHQIQSNVTNARSLAFSLQDILQAIERFPNLPGNVKAPLDEAISALTNVRTNADAVLEAVKDLPPGNPVPPEVKARIAQMKTDTDVAVARIQTGKTNAGSGSGYPWPDNPGCSPGGPAHPYHTTVYLENDVAGAVEWMVGTPGAADHFDEARTRVTPKSIYAQNVTVPGVDHSANIEAILVDNQCRPVSDGTQVVFSLAEPTLGSVSPVTTTTVTADNGQAGVVRTTYTAPSDIAAGQQQVKVNMVSGSAQSFATVDVIGPAHTVTLRRGLKYIRTGGATAIIQADVVDVNRAPVANGTTVTFTIEPANRGTWLPGGGSSMVVPTSGGTAAATLRSGNIAGPATIKASSGPADTTSEVVFVGQPANIQITAVPDRLSTASASLFSVISATVTTNDNPALPAADGTLVEFFLANAGDGSFAGGPSERVTLRDGIASTNLQLNRKSGTVEVWAQVVGYEGVAANTQIQLMPGYYLYLPMLSKNYRQ